MVECKVYIGGDRRTPYNLAFSAAPRKGDHVMFKLRHGIEAEEFEVERVSFLAEDVSFPAEIHLTVSSVS